jgi:hypothetical protein
LACRLATGALNTSIPGCAVPMGVLGAIRLRSTPALGLFALGFELLQRSRQRHVANT